MKIKRKICTNLQCDSYINEPNASICKGCNRSLMAARLVYADEDKIKEKAEEIRNPKSKPDNGGNPDPEEPGGTGKKKEEYVTCPSCGERIVYKPGLELCGCGEFIGDLAPEPGTDTGGSIAVKPIQGGCPVTALRSLDGRCNLPLTGDWLKIGRQAAGKEYFESAGKRKVSREHAIMRCIDGAWYISYCKREDRNYSGGLENPIFINKRRLEREEEYRLQQGDEIGFAEFDTSYTDAAFFRAE